MLNGVFIRLCPGSNLTSNTRVPDDRLPTKYGLSLNKVNDKLFSVIALGNLRSMAYFGLLTGVTMLSALVGELFVTPAVILTFGPRRAGTPEPPKES